MISPQAGFSPTYARARVQFLEGAAEAGLAIRSYNHPLPGLEGETLAVDVALDGAADAQQLLILSSACHGAEGFCGSGVQVFALHDEAWQKHARDAGVAVLYVHALNPYGFSHLRRVTHENVDLNRNFQNFDSPLPLNADYPELHALLLPQAWPPSPANEAAIAGYVAQHGLSHYQATVSQGQYTFEDGLFFGGTSPTWSNTTLRQILRDHGQAARDIAWIDLHTGLGPSGAGERIFASREDEQALRRARTWWGGEGATPITSIYDGTSTSAALTGMMWSAIFEECPQAEYTGIALEYGSVPIEAVINALRGDHWLHVHPEAPESLKQTIRQTMRDAFYVDTDAWRAQVVVQARQALFQAVDGLSKGSA